MPTPADMRQIVEQLVAAFNGRDRAALSATFHDDVVCVGIPLPAAHGRVATMDLLDPFFEAEAIDWQILHIGVGGRMVFTERVDRFRYPGFDWTEVRAVGVFEIADNGLIIAWRDYFDMQELAAALPDSILQGTAS